MCPFRNISFTNVTIFFPTQMVAYMIVLYFVLFLIIINTLYPGDHCISVHKELKKNILLRYNLHMRQFTHLKLMFQWLLFTELCTHHHNFGFPGWLSGKQFASQCRRCRRCGFHPWVEYPLEKGTATHSSILAWIIPWTEELGVLHS